ncbi:MAG: hypothetical protein ACRDSR_23210 [Pseudonocardiaceae bacterium]
MADVLRTVFRFEVTFRRVSETGPTSLGDGGFQEVGGLDVEMDVNPVSIARRCGAGIRAIPNP